LGYAPGDKEFDQTVSYIAQRKFVPGGRYLAMSGRNYHQVNNCFLFRAEDSREGWADVVHRSILSLSSGGGIGVVWSDIRPNGSYIGKTGGIATGPISPASMVNEVARHVMAGGSRRSAIWGGLHWRHPDIFDWIVAKDWSEDQKALKAKDYSAPAPLDMTNISVILDSEFFFAYHNPVHPKHNYAHDVYWKAVTHMLAHGEPGFSIDTGENVNESLRNAPVAGDTHVLTKNGYRPVEQLVGKKTTIWTGQAWAEDVVFTKTQSDAPILAVEMTGGRVIRCEPSHEFLVERHVGAGKLRRLTRIDRIAAKDLQIGDQLRVSYAHDALESPTDSYFDQNAYTLGWLYGDGSFTKAGGADLTLCSEASKQCLPFIYGYQTITECDSRGYTRLYFGVHPRWYGRTKDQFPLDILTKGFAQLRAFIAGLFDADGNWEPQQKRIRLASKHEGFLRDVARALETLGIMGHVTKAGYSTYGQAQTYQLVVAAESMEGFAQTIPTHRLKVELSGYKPYRQSAIKVVSVTADGYEDVYCADVRRPEHSFQAEGVIISNCTEITSADDNDVCNLGSINLARIESADELQDVVKYATLFLVAGTVYSDVPFDRVRSTRAKNRRLGLGLMGLHEWLLARGYDYQVVPELHEWLEVYATSTDMAHHWADTHGLSHPVKTRAIAPNGTISIVAETTSGIEPVFCVAYKRRFLHNGQWKYQYVIDPTVQRLRDQYGIDPDEIEDAYTLALTPEKRIKFQADIQRYVDHGISSTINLPRPTTDAADIQDFGETLLTHLPNLRGITCFPDGARSGQPLSIATYSEAIKQVGVTFEEEENRCIGGVCGV
jgi:ribonucleotide reductase alpha subunit